MTVSNQTTKVTAAGNGVAFVFPFSPLVLYAASDLTVTHVAADGTETLLELGTGAANYSISVSLYPGTGSIIYPADESTPLPTGESLVMRPVYPLTQLTDLENQGGYSPENLERQLDKLVRIDLQQQEQIGRTLALSIASEASAVLPGAVADKVLGWNTAGDALENKTPNTDAYVALPLAVDQGGTGATTAAAALTALGLTPSANGKSLVEAANYAAMRALFSPLTTNGDLWARVAGVDARLAAGSEDTVLFSGPTYVGGPWRGVASIILSGQSLIEFFHDGIDNAGASLQTGYEYRLRFARVFASANATASIQLFEAGAYRAGAGSDDYFNGHFQISGGTYSSPWTATDTAMLIGAMGTTLTNGLRGSLVLQGAASTAVPTAADYFTFGIGAAAVLRSGTSYVTGTNTTRAATKFKLFPSTGTLDGGTVYLERRRLT